MVLTTNDDSEAAVRTEQRKRTTRYASVVLGLLFVVALIGVVIWLSTRCWTQRCHLGRGCKLTPVVPGDAIDNDCDGKIDEEVRDGKDNDGDGDVDEDLELCKMPTQRYGDGIDNDCDGKIDEEVSDGKDNDGDGKIDEDLELTQGNCAVPRELALVSNALRFGDHRLSRAVVNPYDVIPQAEGPSFNRQFNFTFSFRTFQLNGILFYMEPRAWSQDVYITAYLMDGNVVLNFKQPKVTGRGGDQKGLTTDGHSFADGKFHKVQVIKSGKSISLQIDDGKLMEGKVKKSSENVEWSEKLQIGGPRTSTPFKVILYPLQGCIADFRINSHLADLAENALGDNRHAKLCVSPANGAALVRGVHFSGQGYALINDYFVIDDWLQVKLKFKTTSQDGVLLAMGDPESPTRPCLMLELDKGVLRLRLQTQSGTGEDMVTFESTYDEFEEGSGACDNQWHSVDARVVRTVLMLIVDGVDGSSGFLADAQQKHEGSISQYVGGIPDDLRPNWPLKPLSSKNFHGCIKDVVIKDYEKYEDDVVWNLSSSSLKIHNVDISACP